MRITGSGSETEDNTQSQPIMAKQGAVAQVQAPPKGFKPLAFHSFLGIIPPPLACAKPRKQTRRKDVYFSEPEASGYSSSEELLPRAKKESGAKLPPFAQKWFELCKKRKEELYKVRDQWLGEQTEYGNTDAQKDVDGMKKVMPQFAAKWFALTEEEKEEYRAIRKANKLEKNDGVDIPGFAAKWFALPEKKKSEIRKIKRRLRASKKAWLSDGEADQTEPEIDYEHDSVPAFATKWFSLPKARKDEIKMKYRHQNKCKRHEWNGLDAMMMQLQGLRPEVKGPPSMMYQYGRYPMPWMGPWYQQGYPMCAPPSPFMYPQCNMAPPLCMKKRMHKAQHRMRCKKGFATSDTSGDESEKHPTTTTDSESSDEQVIQMPPFVNKWFALPMEARKQLRMLHHQQKDSKATGDGIPPFAKKWFALPEKTKQQMRKLNRQENHGCRKHHKKRIANREAMMSQCQSHPEKIEATLLKSDAENGDIPEFVRMWFSLPVDEKHRLRMLNHYLSSKSDAETSEDEINETMPDFAKQWFALSSKDRQRFRNLRSEKKAKKEKAVCHKMWWKHFRRSGGRPWQQWAFHSMPPMGGPKHGVCQHMQAEKCLGNLD